MRKFLAAALVLCMITANAQKYTVNVQAGGNTSFIPKFDNEYVYAQRPLNPYEFLDPGDDHFTAGIGIDNTKAEKKIGFFADVQMERHLENNWSISASLGVNNVAYSYETPTFGIATTDPTLKDALNKIGDVKLLYLTTRLANISKKWNRFALTAGPELNYLLSKKYISSVSWQWQSAQNDKQYISSVNDSKSDAHKFLIGATLGARYDIGKSFYARLGSQKIFTSLYKKGNTESSFYKSNVHEKSRPIQIELGIGYRFAGF